MSALDTPKRAAAHLVLANPDCPEAGWKLLSADYTFLAPSTPMSISRASTRMSTRSPHSSPLPHGPAAATFDSKRSPGRMLGEGGASGGEVTHRRSSIRRLK